MSWVWYDTVSGDLWCKRCGETIPWLARPLAIDTAVEMSKGFERAHRHCKPLEYPEEAALAYYDRSKDNYVRLVEIVDFDKLIDKADLQAQVTVRYLESPDQYFKVRACVLKPITEVAGDILRGGSEEDGVTFTFNL